MAFQLFSHAERADERSEHQANGCGDIIICRTFLGFGHLGRSFHLFELSNSGFSQLSFDERRLKK